ncbi:hypothetical protein MN608_10677 [Microdochium nivale]|nr:hypothetical protein MN608_10677 [Microdochium nivale]
MSRQMINDAEFDDWLQSDEEDTNWIAQQAAQRFTLSLPWKRQAIRLGTCFQSERLWCDPWLEDTPFILSDFYTIPKILRVEAGCSANFNFVATSRKSETSKHMSLGFGAGLGPCFIASASVRGTYDEHVIQNNDSDKSSTKATLRCGILELGRKPRLCHEALAMLKYGGGYESFTARYGDYYIWGYQLGGDTGIMVSSSAFKKEVIEKYTVTAAAKIVGFEVSKTSAKDIHSFGDGKRMRLVGYDTLSDTSWSVKMEAPEDIESLSRQAGQAMLQSQSLMERCLQWLGAHDMHDGENLTDAQCELLAGSGIAVELILLPMSSLRDVARWTTEHNVI